MIECPHCHLMIESVEFVEQGHITWNGSEWIEEFRLSNAVFMCTLCRKGISFDYLESKGVL